jgi:hypothetical protein
MKSQPLDQYLQKHFQQLKGLQTLVKKEEEALTDAGCILAYPHVKKGTAKMYLRGPASEDRSYTYVGVDEQKQLDALAQIDRYKRREDVERLQNEIESTRSDLEEHLHELNRELQMLIKDASLAVNEAREVLKEVQQKQPARRLQEWRKQLLSAAARAGDTTTEDVEDEEPTRRTRPAVRGRTQRSTSAALSLTG